MQSLIEKYIVEMPSKEDDNTHCPLESTDNTHFSSKDIIVDTHQPLSADSVKSLENSYELSISITEARERNETSPLQTSCSGSSSGIYELIWPEPKSIVDLGHISPPFIVGKELLISIIQVSIQFVK